MNVAPLPGFTPWPEEFVARYRALGYWQGETFGQFLRKSATRFPLREAIVCGGRRWNYAELDRRADQLAAGFHRFGLRARDRVVVQMPNIGEFYPLCFGLFRVGAIPVFALPAHRRAEIGHFIRFAEAKAYVIADQDQGFDYRTLARQMCSEAPDLQVIVAGEAQEFVALETLYDTPRRLEEPGPDEVAFLQLSGGSTGLPKLIPRTHDDYLYSVRASAEICALDENTVFLCALPVAHNFPLSSPGSLGVFYAGGKVVLAQRPAPEACFPLIAEEKVTMSALVPPLALLWLEAAESRRDELKSLKLLQVGGAKFAAEAASRVPSGLGCRLQQVFGMAEGLVNYTRDEDSEELVNTTQGRPISPQDEVRIVDDEDQPVAAGEVGHLLTRGPYTIRGYYCAEEHNVRAFTSDGFYRTGDMVRLLPSGHLIVEGRAKDQINRGGEKIAAEEVENHLLAHPLVLDAAVVAMPDAYMGEKTCAFIILREGKLRPAELNRFLRERGIAQYKIPDRIAFLDQFPKTGVGKVNKRALRELVLQQMGTRN